MDTVFVTDLRATAVIGIFEWERRIRQTLAVDLELAADCASAAATDHIDQATDYKAISKWVVARIEASEYQLLETLAEDLAQGLRQEHGVAWLRLTLHKPGAVRDARDVGVILERGERP